MYFINNSPVLVVSFGIKYKVFQMRLEVIPCRDGGATST